MNKVSRLEAHKAELNQLPGTFSYTKNSQRTDAELFQEFSNLVDKIASRVSGKNDGSAVDKALTETARPLPRPIQEKQRDFLQDKKGELPEIFDAMVTREAREEAIEVEGDPQDSSNFKENSASDDSANQETKSDSSSEAVSRTSLQSAPVTKTDTTQELETRSAEQSDLTAFEGGENAPAETKTIGREEAKKEVASLESVKQHPLAKYEPISEASTTEVIKADTSDEIEKSSPTVEKSRNDNSSASPKAVSVDDLAKTVARLIGDTQSNAKDISSAARAKLSVDRNLLQIGEAKSTASNGQVFGQGNRVTTQRAEELKSRPLPRFTAQVTIEKVENALKEVAKSKDGRTISLRLDPPDLGTVKIDVTMRDGGLHARLMAEASTVSALLKDRASDLQVTLRKLGLNVDTITVTVVSDDARREAFPEQKDGGSAKKKSGSSAGSDFNGISSPVNSEAVSAPLDHWVA